MIVLHTCPHRYKQLLFYATKLSPLPAEDHNSENKVEGCVSQVGVGAHDSDEMSAKPWFDGDQSLSLKTHAAHQITTTWSHGFT